jgi:hypothetical protein
MPYSTALNALKDINPILNHAIQFVVIIFILISNNSVIIIIPMDVQKIVLLMIIILVIRSMDLSHNAISRKSKSNTGIV